MECVNLFKEIYSCFFRRNNFSGNHQCVAVINNFIPRGEIDYYTVPRGLETEPKLASALSGSVHKFAMQVTFQEFLVV